MGYSLKTVKDFRNDQTNQSLKIKLKEIEDKLNQTIRGGYYSSKYLLRSWILFKAVNINEARVNFRLVEGRYKFEIYDRILIASLDLDNENIVVNLYLNRKNILKRLREIKGYYRLP